MNLSYHYTYLLGILFLLSACGKNEIEDLNLDYGYNYFPLEIGKTWIYQVDSIVFDPAILGTAIDTMRTFFREEIVDTLLDQTSQTWYRVERSERTADTLPWQIKSVFRIAATKEQAFRTEDNLQFIKLTFPIQEGKNWNGNVFFDETKIVQVAGESIEMFKGWSYQIETVDQSLALGNLSFEKVATITQANSENLIEYRFSQEQYAREVGLIYRELWILDTQCEICCNGDFSICEPLTWPEKAEKGFVLKQQLIDYK